MQALQDAEIALYNQKQITPDEHRLLQEGFKTLFQTDKSVRQCIYTTDAPGCVDAGIQAVNYFVTSKANGIKNPDSQKQMVILSQAVLISLNTLKAAL